MSERLQVVLDVGPAVHQGAGLARYTERLADHLLREQAGDGGRVDLTLFFNAHSGHNLPVSLAKAKARSVSMGQYAWRLGVLAGQLVGRPDYAQYIPDGQIYHATEHLLPRLPKSTATVLTVHDLIFERFPQHHTLTNRLFLKLAMPLFVRRADAIIAVSHSTKQDLVDLYSTPPAKIHVIHEGIDERFAPIGPPGVHGVKSKYSPDRPYLLMVGTLEPRKNHAAALDLLARLKAAEFPHRLVIAGGKGWLFDPIQRQVDALGLTDDVVFAGFVPDEALPALYTGAACVVMPSLYEGFGFPVLEAMACGAPVVCSNVSSLPEVAGDAALLVDPLDGDALFAAVRRVLTEPDLARYLGVAGQRQAAGFRWDRTAAETVGVYAAVWADVEIGH